MVERHIELRLDLLVAAVAQVRLSFDKQEFILACMMGRMTAQAAQIVLAVRRAGKVHVALPRAVAFKASLVYFFCGSRLEAENLLGISIFCVGSSRTVAGFAAVNFRPLLRLQNNVPVASVLDSLEHVFMASLARVCSHVLGRPGNLLRGFFG